MENTSIHTDWQGKLIGRYQLERVLGSGALSEVWLATDTRLRREVAIKLLPPATNDQSYLRDFVYEARAAASLEHPHILVIHDFGEGELDGEVVPYLVFPYIAGGTLATRMKEADGPLPIQESLRYLHHAALAIDYAHSKRILHRDIKPANMLLRDDWLLLTDFGLARVLGGSMVRSQTSAGSGTPEYMAPEQIMGQATPASDRYSLAVVAYQLFTGRPPYHGTTPVETITRQMHDPLPPPRSFSTGARAKTASGLAAASRNGFSAEAGRRRPAPPARPLAGSSSRTCSVPPSSPSLRASRSSVAMARSIATCGSPSATGSTSTSRTLDMAELPCRPWTS